MLRNFIRATAVQRLVLREDAIKFKSIYDTHLGEIGW